MTITAAYIEAVSGLAAVTLVEAGDTAPTVTATGSASVIAIVNDWLARSHREGRLLPYDSADATKADAFAARIEQARNTIAALEGHTGTQAQRADRLENVCAELIRSIIWLAKSELARRGVDINDA